jgi:hypothetical protein
MCARADRHGYPQGPNDQRRGPYLYGMCPGSIRPARQEGPFRQNLAGLRARNLLLASAKRRFLGQRGDEW